MGSQPRREALRRWDPERIGPYAVLGRLGSGSMGQVYLGRSAAGRLVAVKTIRVELAEEAGFRTRFAQEVAAARKVSGVFTAAVVEADPEADLPWLATAYVPAPSLARLVLACGPLPVTTVRWLAAGCAEALASIHGAGLVHRDLKPSNVLVAPDGPRVIDFGVARAAERMGRSTARGVVGTPAYMAPEQARDTHEASVASDVYSLGATLLFAATGHPPYSGATVMDVLARLATEEPDLSGLPGELTELISACMHRVPRLRPTSSAMLVQLGDFTVAQGGPDEEHSYLPDKAMALIAEYQRSPQLGPRRRVRRRAQRRRHLRLLHRASRLLQARPPAQARSRPAARRGAARVRLAAMAAGHMAWAGWASVGAALVVVGVILGAALSSSSTPNPASSNSVRLGAVPPRRRRRRPCAVRRATPYQPPVPVHAEPEPGHRGCRVGRPGQRLRPPDLGQGLADRDDPPNRRPSVTSHRTAQVKPAVARTGRSRCRQPALPRLAAAGTVHRQA